MILELAFVLLVLGNKKRKETMEKLNYEDKEQLNTNRGYMIMEVIKWQTQ